VVARLAVELTERCAELTITIKALEKEITELTTQLAPALLELPGCGALTAAKIIGETAGDGRAYLKRPGFCAAFILAAPRG
jgi:transposase